MRYVKSLPPESGMPGSAGKPTTRSSELRQKLRRSICCVLIGTMLLGTGAPGSLAMDRDNSPWPLNHTDLGEFTPDSTVVTVDGSGSSGSCSLSCTMQSMAGNSSAALAQQASPSYRPSGKDALKIWRDIIKQMGTTSVALGAVAYTRFGAFSNIPSAKLVLSAPSLGAFGVHVARAHLVFFLTQFLARQRNPDGTRKFSDEQVELIVWSLNTVCEIGIAAAAAFAAAHADDWAGDKGNHRRKVLSGDFDGLGHGEVGNRMMDLVIAMSRAFVKDGLLYLPTPLGTCPSKIVELPKVPVGTDASVTIRHWDRNEKPMTSRATSYNTLGSWPVKIVADGDRTWLLSGAEQSGFNIYRMNQFSSLEATLANINNWTRIPGRAIDLFPGPNFVFAINSDKDVFQCAWPCNTGNWSNMNIKAVSVAVGPRMVSTTNPDTTGQPVYVWVKDSHGHVSRRLERFPGGLWHRVNNRADIPPRIRALLDERDTYDDWANWHLRYKYPALRR